MNQTTFTCSMLKYITSYKIIDLNDSDLKCLWNLLIFFELKYLKTKSISLTWNELFQGHILLTKHLVYQQISILKNTWSYFVVFWTKYDHMAAMWILKSTKGRLKFEFFYKHLSIVEDHALTSRCLYGFDCHWVAVLLINIRHLC